MNERIKELALQAGLQNTLGCFWQSSDDAIECFAELVRQDERKLCAKLCLELTQAKASGDSYEDGTVDCAAAIRARGNHEHD